MKTFIKENVKSNKLQAQNIEKIWDIVKSQNKRVRTEEGKEIQVKDTENIFNKKHRRIFFSNLKKKIPVMVIEA